LLCGPFRRCGRSGWSTGWLAPYLGDTSPPSKLLARPTATAVPFVVVRLISRRGQPCL
jgi:hypothetical protein